MHVADESQNVESRKVERIVILGGGSAGLLVALALRKHLPHISVVNVRSSKLGVIGVGEGTILSVLNFLHNFLEIDRNEFRQKVRPTLKLGIHYLWGPRPSFNYSFTNQFSQPLEKTETKRGYFCHEECDFADLGSALMAFDKACLVNPDGKTKPLPQHAYHLENRTFVSYLEKMVDEFGVQTIDDFVVEVEQNSFGVKSLKLESGRVVDGDLFIDASGFKSLLIQKALGVPFVEFKDSLFCDTAIFGGWDRSEGDVFHPYTTAETMNAGWCWRIEHETKINRGYVYSSDFISDEEAEQEFKAKNSKIEGTHRIRFRSGVISKPWTKNVIAIGNSAGFVEPLEATAIGMICDSSVNIVRALKASCGHVDQVQISAFNRLQNENWEIIRDFLALHYRFNFRINTPFWKKCTSQTPLGRTKELVDYFQSCGPDLSLLGAELRRDFFGEEGYLAMLIGQKVPYQRHPSFTLGEKNQWKVVKNRLRDSMYSAIDMNEYMKLN